MTKTLFDIIDSWTLNWDRKSVETTLNQVAASFYKRKKVFFLLEDLWDTMELIDDPYEFMTEDRKKEYIEQLLSNAQIERAAKSVLIEHTESPESIILVLNVDEIISKHPAWFEEYDPLT